MQDDEFPIKVEDLIVTLAEMYRHQNRPEIADLLETAEARIDQTNYDNWNGGTFIYDLMLNVPVATFATFEAKLTETEKSISSKLSAICRDLGNHRIDNVIIVPETLNSASVATKEKPADAKVKHIWQDGYFRLFLSHISKHQAQAAKLKIELQMFGISAFVAHKDVIPTAEWQDEIELALRSMHALAALLTPNFQESLWTDQEIGFGLGKGVLVIPIRLGIDPYGFIGKVQGLPGTLDDPAALAALICSTLLRHKLTHTYMRKALPSAFLAANSFNSAIRLSNLITTVQNFTSDEKAILQRACKENKQVIGAWGVVSKIQSAFGLSKIKMDADVPF